MALPNLRLNLSKNWQFFLVITLPLLLLPLLFISDDELIGTPPNTRHSTKFKCAFVLLLMAIYWMVEALPLAITALLPMVLFPLLGIQDTASVSMNYMRETNMMFVGGLIIGLAVEYCNLHRRIALNVMTTLGCSPARLMSGVMLTTLLLSMWMSNTATAAMVSPIAITLIDELYPKEQPRKRHASIYKERSEVDFDSFVQRIKAKKAKLEELKEKQQFEFPVISEEQEKSGKLSFVDPEPLELDRFTMEMEDEDPNSETRIKLKKMLLFSILLSCNIGGTGVITGSPSNLVFQELIKHSNVSQGGRYVDITFATWMAYNIPPMLVNVVLAWLYLVIVYTGVSNCFWRRRSEAPAEEEETERLSKVANSMEEKKRALGPMSFHESAIFTLFLTIVCLWLFRDPKFMPGWAEQVASVHIGDSTPALAVVLLLFIIPRNLETFFSGMKTPPLLDWKYVQLNLPWGVVLLMGGGFALSSAAVHSGLSQWLGQQLESVASLPPYLILIVVVFLSATVTEVASNSACVNVLIPILIALSESLNLHPLYLTLPATVACSIAFLLPVATPTNAIVFAAGGGDITIMEMVKVMLIPNFVSIFVIILSHLVYGNFIFNFGQFVYPANPIVLS